MSRPLELWNDGRTRDSILEFVAAVSQPGNDYVPPEQRIAVFDNDGTLWCEKPLPIQLDFTIRRFAELAEEQPELRTRQPYQAAYDKDLHWLGAAMVKHYHGDDGDLQLLMQAVTSAFDDRTVDEYDADVREFFASATHPTLNRSYLDCGYAPMVQLLRYLEANGFTCYIVSGGDRDFMRPMTFDYYGIPAERVVGSAVGLSYDAESNEVRYGTSFAFFDDGPEKPVRIWSRIGRRPVLAAGNSNGDIPMLDYVRGHRRSLSLLVHHDDDTGRGDQPYDKGSELALAAVASSGFVEISVKDDWDSVFVEQPA